jgi:hypothetical protein
MVKIRLEGTLRECQQAAPGLAELFDVVSVRDPYANRGRSRLVRVYLEIRLGGQRQADPDGATERRRGRQSRRAERELPPP